MREIIRVSVFSVPVLKKERQALPNTTGRWQHNTISWRNRRESAPGQCPVDGQQSPVAGYAAAASGRELHAEAQGLKFRLFEN